MMFPTPSKGVWASPSLVHPSVVVLGVGTLGLLAVHQPMQCPGLPLDGSIGEQEPGGNRQEGAGLDQPCPPALPSPLSESRSRVRVGKEGPLGVPGLGGRFVPSFPASPSGS